MTNAQATPASGTATTLGLTALLFCGAMFGFFYAWVCSTMWGLDTADPRVSIAAMQAMNLSVRNAVFFPAFFLTSLVCFAAAYAYYRDARRQSARFFIAAGLVYGLGGMFYTVFMLIPTNEAFATVEIPADIEEARTIWTAYSEPWQVRNITRTIFCGLALLLAGIGLARSA